MCKMLEEMREEAAKKAAEKASKEASKNKSIEVAKNMLADVMPFEKVAKYTGLPLETVKELATIKIA